MSVFDLDIEPAGAWFVDSRFVSSGLCSTSGTCYVKVLKYYQQTPLKYYQTFDLCKDFGPRFSSNHALSYSFNDLWTLTCFLCFNSRSKQKYLRTTYLLCFGATKCCRFSTNKYLYWNICGIFFCNSIVRQVIIDTVRVGFSKKHLCKHYDFDVYAKRHFKNQQSDNFAFVQQIETLKDIFRQIKFWQNFTIVMTFTT